MTGFNAVGRYAEVDVSLMHHSEIHSSFFNQSTYSDIRGTKEMHGTEGTYLFLDFSQSNHSDKIRQENFARTNYADIKLPLLRRHSSTDKDMRELPSYAELDFTNVKSKFSTMEDMDTNNSNRYLNVHGSKTVYSKIRSYSSEEIDLNDTKNSANLYAKVLPKSQRKSIHNSPSFQDVGDTKNNSDQLFYPHDSPIQQPDNRRRTLEPKYNKIPLTPSYSLENLISPYEQRCEVSRKPPVDLTPHKVLVSIPRETTPNRNPPPIRPKPHSAPPVPPHTKSIPITPQRYHNNADVRLARKSIHGSTECLASMEIGTAPMQCIMLGRSHSFRAPNRAIRPDKPPPPPPPSLKPTFHAFHPNNPIMFNRHIQLSNADTKEKLDISIPTSRARSQGDSGIIVAQKENTPTQSNCKFKINNIFNTAHKTYKPANNTKPPVITAADRNAELSHSIGDNRDTNTNKYKFTPITLPKSFLHQNPRPNLPPKPKPRLKQTAEDVVFQGYIWKQNPKTSEWSQWFAILDLFTLKLYQSKEDRPWLTVPTTNFRDVNTFILEGLESQLAFSLVTTMKSYVFSSNSIDETKKWVKVLSTLMS